MRILALLTTMIAITSAVSATVIINEMLPQAASDWYPNDNIGDMNDEFIELYNSGEEDLDISNYTLTDLSYRKAPGLYTFPEGTLITAGGFLVVYSVESGVFQGNSGDGIQLNDSSGNVVDEKVYQKALGGDVSLARIPDGGDWSISSFPTPGEPNTQVALIKAVYLSRDADSVNFSIDDFPATNLKFGENSPYQKVTPGEHDVKLEIFEDDVEVWEMNLMLDAEIKKTLLISDISDPILAEDALGIPEVKTAWIRFVNLVPGTSTMDVTLPEGGKVWYEGNKTEVEEGGYIFQDMEYREVADYVAVYSKATPIEVVVSGSQEVLVGNELELGDEGIYTVVLSEDSETSEKDLLVIVEYFQE